MIKNLIESLILKKVVSNGKTPKDCADLYLWNYFLTRSSIKSYFKTHQWAIA